MGLNMYLFTERFGLKTKKGAVEKRIPISYKPLSDQPVQLSIEKANGKLIGLDWSTGLVFSQAQNLARELMGPGTHGEPG
ncbi:hypothetical protein PGTUg99_003924 [Puccinia graminis f. sp. tritici]|uniref:Uncharacterized protein n=1 Tax=Puccinia graminis f. sp. tritici TaxID=56615 RepID=A0A5B0RM59_PUCGR|nr:hypothetical protein PGTUg99_003924 [Puccinia graminis f. sp. tritici]